MTAYFYDFIITVLLLIFYKEKFLSVVTDNDMKHFNIDQGIIDFHMEI